MGAKFAKASNTDDQSPCYVNDVKPTAAVGLQILLPANQKKNINDLDDLSLIEILLRLPTPKFTTQCELVSKRWYSLISTPYFARRFIKHHDHIHSTKPKPFAIFFYVMIGAGSVQPIKLTNLDPIFKSPRFNLLFLHSAPMRILLTLISLLAYLTNENFSVAALIQASYKDLLLCHLGDSDRVYYICNPFTKQWVALPPYPHKWRNVDVIIGFVCDDKSCRVVRIPHYQSSIHSFVVEIFSSETRRWSELVVLYPYNFCFKSSNFRNIFACNGIMYWLDLDNNYIVAYNPYKPENCCMISEPKGISGPKSIQQHSNYLGVCQESLQLLQLFHANLTLKLWKLVDYHHPGKWKLMQKVSLQPTITEYFQLQQDYSELTASNVKTLALHPTEQNLVYFTIKDYIVLFNLPKQQMELVDLELVDRTIYHRRIGYYASGIFPLVLPRWPSRVPQLK